MAKTIDEMLRTHRAFRPRHRILDNSGVVHQVVVVGDLLTDVHEVVIGTHGYYVDITPSSDRAREDLISARVAEITEHRAVIEQAKGMLMLIYGLDDEAAFDLLRWRSQTTNVKLRQLAQKIVEEFRTLGDDGMTPRSAFDHVLLEGVEEAAAATAMARPLRRPMAIDRISPPRAPPARPGGSALLRRRADPVRAGARVGGARRAVRPPPRDAPRAANEFGAEPVTLQVCPVCLGLPGLLVLNEAAVESAIRIGVVLNRDIAPWGRFAREEMTSTPTSRRTTEISQYDEPIAVHGYLDVPLDDGTTFRVRDRARRHGGRTPAS